MNFEKKYSIGIGFTSACNMNCGFCYSHDKRKIVSGVTLDVWKRFISNNAKFIKNINYGTGENALSAEWFDLVAFIGKKFSWIKQAVTTNGTLAERCQSSDKFYEIATKYISEVDVSIDFCDQAKHDSIRGKIGAFQGAVDSLEFCAHSNIQATIVSIGVDDTLKPDNLKGLFGLARKYNAFFRINLYRPVRESTGYKPPSLVTVLNALDWIDENEKIISLSDPFFRATCTADGVHSDPTGISSLRITQDGNIYPSTYLLLPEYCIGNITENPIIPDFDSGQIIQDIQHSLCAAECKGCSLYERCKGGTVDRRILVNGTLNSRDPYCPGKFGGKACLRYYTECSEGFSSVHDEYLPTLFFAPRNMEESNGRL